MGLGRWLLTAIRDNATQRQANRPRRHPLKISSKLAEAGLAVASCRTTRVASPCSLSRSLRARALLLPRRWSNVGAGVELPRISSLAFKLAGATLALVALVTAGVSMRLERSQREGLLRGKELSAGAVTQLFADSCAPAGLSSTTRPTCMRLWSRSVATKTSSTSASGPSTTVGGSPAPHVGARARARRGGDSRARGRRAAPSTGPRGRARRRARHQAQGRRRSGDRVLARARERSERPRSRAPRR